MLTHVRAAAPRRALPSLPLQPPEPGAALLDSFGAIEDEEHILGTRQGRPRPDVCAAASRRAASDSPPVA